MASTYGNYLNTYYTAPSAVSYNQKAVSAPAIASAPSTLNYSGPKAYTPYQQQNSNSVYANYLKNEYSDPTKLATNQKGETTYDLQRQKVSGDVEAERQRQQEDLKRRLAASGMDNSGLAFKQNRQLGKDLGTYEGQQMSGIATEEMAARQEQATRLGEQAFTSEETAQERAEAQRQFDSDNILRAKMKESDLAMAAWEKGDKMAYDRWVEQNNINKSDADRAWETGQNERGIQSRLNELIAGRSMDADAENRKIRTNYYYTAGQAGSLDDAALADLQANDPDAYNSYMYGKEGKTVEQATSDNEFRNSIRDSLIVNANDPIVTSQLLDIAKRNNLDVGNWENIGGEGSSNGAKVPRDSRLYTTRLSAAKPFSPSVEYKTGGGVDNGWYFNSPPATGQDFTFEGKLYRRTDDPLQRDQSGPNHMETEYMMVEDVETGEVKRIDASYWSEYKNGTNANNRKAKGF